MVQEQSDDLPPPSRCRPPELKERSKAILDRLPVVDFTIEDIPVEEGIALLYQKQESPWRASPMPVPWLEKYSKAFELGFQTALEYRINFAISLISAAYPIFIQTFLWTAIYRRSRRTRWCTALPTGR